MLYIKIGEQKYPIESFNVFTTQNGQTGVRITGDTPLADGFEIYDEDTRVADGKDYTYLYREDGNVKEYTKEAEEIIPTQSFATGDYPDSAFDVLSRRISAVNSRVTQITPYTESKTAYIDDTDVFFDIPKDGNISVFMVDGEGQNVPCTFEQINGQIKVLFEKRESLATVTISIQ